MGFDFAALRASFFDADKVVKAVSQAKRKAFSKAGAYIRQRAKTSIKKKKGSAPAGNPPHAHAGQIRLIFFAWDARAESVVVGPIEFTSARGPKGGARLLEKGGAAEARDRRGRLKKYRYAGHPFMRPAMVAELPKFAGLLKGTIGG